MTSVSQEDPIRTVASSTRVGVDPDIVDVREGIFDVLSVSGAGVVVTEGAQTVNGAKTFTDLRLPTVGGIPSSFNYSEDGTFTANVIGAATGPVIFSFARYGKGVTLTWTNFNRPFGVPSTLQIVAAIPPRLLPILPLSAHLVVLDNGLISPASGRLDIDVGGSITVYSTLDGGIFNGPGDVGFRTSSINYRVA